MKINELRKLAEDGLQLNDLQVNPEAILSLLSEIDRIREALEEIKTIARYYNFPADEWLAKIAALSEAALGE